MQSFEYEREHLMQESKNRINRWELRSLEESDVEELKYLHDQCFPLRYPESFYQTITQKQNSDSSLFSIGAIEDGRLIGALTARFIHISLCGETNLINKNSGHTHVVYILTLATSPQVRRCGLGSLLLRECLNYASKFEKCGAVYLHVITYNHDAIKFYEANGFSRLREIHNYYTINKKHYNSFVYFHFVNGGSHPVRFSWHYSLSGPFLRCLENAFLICIKHQKK